MQVQIVRSAKAMHVAHTSTVLRRARAAAAGDSQCAPLGLGVMFRLLGILITVLFAIATAIVVWPQFFHLEQVYPFAQLVAVRGAVVAAFLVIAVVSLLLLLAVEDGEDDGKDQHHDRGDHRFARGRPDDLVRLRPDLTDEFARSGLCHRVFLRNPVMRPYGQRPAG